MANEKPDLAFDVYRPLVRIAFFVWSHLQTVLAASGLGRLFSLLRRALTGPPVALDGASLLNLGTSTAGPVNIDATLEMIIGQGGCPGIAALALRGDRIIAQGVAGFRKKGAAERITLSDQFHLGSCSKAMTATLAAILIEEGKLNWTTTLAELFSDVVKDMHPAWRGVTLEQVLRGMRRAYFFKRKN